MPDPLIERIFHIHGDLRTAIEQLVAIRKTSDSDKLADLCFRLICAQKWVLGLESPVNLLLEDNEELKEENRKLKVRHSFNAGSDERDWH